MKLRYRLFLWVGILFVTAFVASFYVEEHVSRKNLNKTRQTMVETLYQVNEQKRQSIEDYIADILWRIRARVDAVLRGVARYHLVERGFMPSLQNLKDGTWLDSASLMITNQWIGFIQNTNEDALMSEIIIDIDELSDTYHFPVTADFHFVAIQDKKSPEAWKGPYIGIILDLSSLHEKTSSAPYKEPDESYLVLFSPQTILDFKADQELSHSLNLSINLLEPFLKWIQIPSKTFFLSRFIKRISDAKEFLEKNPHAVPTHEQWVTLIKKREQEQPKHGAVNSPCFSDFDKKAENISDPKLANDQQAVFHYVKHYIEHYNKIGLVWGISALTDTNLFHKDPIGSNSPYGMAMVDKKHMCGKALVSNEVFKKEKSYDVKKALKDMKLPNDFLIAHLDIITPKGLHHIFFGNTLKLTDSGRVGYLTIGAHGGPVLNALARSTHQVSMFVSNGDVIAVSSPDGEELPANAPWYDIPLQNMIDKTSGIIDCQGKEYFFLHIAPYKQTDLHFFIFNLKSKEFQFIDSINERSKKLIEKVSTQMRIGAVVALIIVLILLNNIAKRVTKPIAHLAEVTQAVAEGKLHEINIPEETKGKTRDEVHALYHAFFGMLKGLREKEKVRGVLNKVVSKEIAEETLKGNVQLGGEEKRATVFFADIRGFTAMTEHMSPQDVIHLINSCMTKVSEKIDEYGGVIDKYIGDEVMALFGAPIEKKDSALNAIKCAVDTLQTFIAWNQEREARNEPKIELGIGIHTGTVVAGNMGAKDRLNYTVLGANVNLASRLCNHAESMQILISRATLDEEDVKVNTDVESLDPIELKGFTEPVSIFTVKSYRKGI